MEHPDHGRLQALLDQELRESEASNLQAHLGRCDACQKKLQGLASAAEAAAASLALLDAEPRVQEARQAIRAYRARIESRGSAASTGSWVRMSLPKAASIALLLTGVTVTALPGSPVRRWLKDGWTAFFSPSSQPAVTVSPAGDTDPPTEPAPDVLAEAGAGIPMRGDAVEIVIREMDPGAELVVRWTDGEEAWVFAGEGTRFNTVAGRLEATAPPGGVRIEIPRDASAVDVILNGNLLLRKTNGEVELRGDVLDRTPSEIRFAPSGPPNERTQGSVEKP
jgi:anti-sigma factor RsiW